MLANSLEPPSGKQSACKMRYGHTVESDQKCAPIELHCSKLHVLRPFSMNKSPRVCKQFTTVANCQVLMHTTGCAESLSPFRGKQQQDLQ